MKNTSLNGRRFAVYKIVKYSQDAELRIGAAISSPHAWSEHSAKQRL